MELQSYRASTSMRAVALGLFLLSFFCSCTLIDPSYTSVAADTIGRSSHHYPGNVNTIIAPGENSEEVETEVSYPSGHPGDAIDFSPYQSLLFARSLCTSKGTLSNRQVLRPGVPCYIALCTLLI